MVHDLKANVENMATLTWSARRRYVSGISARSSDCFRFKSQGHVTAEYNGSLKLLFNSLDSKE